MDQDTLGSPVRWLRVGSNLQLLLLLSGKYSGIRHLAAIHGGSVELQGCCAQFGFDVPIAHVACVGHVVLVWGTLCGAVSLKELLPDFLVMLL